MRLTRDRKAKDSYSKLRHGQELEKQSREGIWTKKWKKTRYGQEIVLKRKEERSRKMEMKQDMTGKGNRRTKWKDKGTSRKGMGRMTIIQKEAEIATSIIFLSRKKSWKGSSRKKWRKGKIWSEHR